MPSPSKNVDQAFALAKERYAEIGVDVDKALEKLSKIPISLHCWQGDDVGGFENAAKGSAPAWPSPATTPARPAPPTSCAGTSTRPCR